MSDLRAPDFEQPAGIDHEVVRSAFDTLFATIEGASSNIKRGVKLVYTRQPTEEATADPYRISDEQLATLDLLLSAIGSIPDGASIYDVKVLIRTSSRMGRSDTVSISGYLVLDTETYPTVDDYAPSTLTREFHFEIARDRGEDEEGSYDEFTISGFIYIPTIFFHSLDGVELERFRRELESIQVICLACNTFIQSRSIPSYSLQGDLALLKFLQTIVEKIPAE